MQSFKGFKIGDKIRIKKDYPQNRIFYDKHRHGEIYVITKFCDCKVAHPGHREIGAAAITPDGLGRWGFIAYDDAVELLEPKQQPTNDIEWLDRIQSNFKE